MTEWFKQWFGEEYHDLYAHRDEADARRVVALIRNVGGGGGTGGGLRSLTRHAPASA